MPEDPGLSAYSQGRGVGTALACEDRTMDRWIKTAWRAFWVGLGASAVLVTQAVLAPSHPAAPVAPDAPALEAPRPQLSPAAARPITRTPADPVISRIPRCATVANVTRCS
jgi:hypothetical protein